MRLLWSFCTVLLVVGLVNSSPIVKSEAEDDLSPLNEVYVIENDDDPGANDDRTDRDKRKIGVIKLGVSNGIINFVFGKLDAFLDAKTKALSVLDESNKAKNVAFGIDASQSATSQFINNLIGQKIQAGTASIGPVINSATTFLSSAKNGLTGAFVSKFAPLSSIATSLSSSAGAGSAGSDANASTGSSGIIGALLSGLSESSSGLSNSPKGDLGASNGGAASAGVSASAGINLGGLANLGGGENVATTTEEDIPEFDRMRVSLEIPPPAFGAGFTLITNVSKVISSVILNSARRTQTLLEIFKPFFRGIFAIKGLPSDNPQ